MDDDRDDFHRRLVESVEAYAIYGLDPAGRVLSWSRGAERMLGYRAEEILGESFSTFYPKQDVEAGRPLAELDAAARSSRRAEGSSWRVRKDGSRFQAGVSLSAVRDDSGRLMGFAEIVRDLAQRRALEKALHVIEERFTLLVQTVQDYAILLLDTDGRVSSWNVGAERIKGWKADEIIGRPFTLFYPEEAVAAGFPQHELEVAARDGRFEDEGWRVRKDGSRFWANVVITALRDETGEVIGYAKVTRDLTERRATEEEARRLAVERATFEEARRRSDELTMLNEQLQEQAAELEAQNTEIAAMAEELQQSNDELQRVVTQAEAARERAEGAAAATHDAYRELDQFAYVASHDLKAPLRGIANLAQWIQDDLGDRLQGESAEHLRLLQGRVQRMEALIEGILAYSRAGRIVTEPETVHVGDLVAEVVELLAPPAGVEVEIRPGLPVLHAERVPLEQVFMNLVGNAIKYSSAVRPDVHVRVGYRDLGHTVEFSVDDNGPGIAPEYHERIWGLFQTLAARDRVEGTGIGLSVVKKIVEARGGRIALDSKPGEGSSFRFTWPKTGPAERGG